MKNGFKCGQQAVSSEYPPTFSHVPAEMFPLFLTQSEFLKMLDGTLAEPFWPRNEDGTLKHNMISTFHEEDGMLERLPDEDFDDLSDSDDGNDEHENKQHTQTGNDKGRLEINYEVFLTRIWPKLSNTLTKQTSKNVSPGSLFQEIHSYIKGSADSLRSSNGRLTRVQYNGLGAKMAPNFRKAFMDDLPSDRSDSRDFVYDLYEQYEREKSLLNAYDVSDVVFHIWGQLQKIPPQQRTPIHSVYIDETQDFTQGELSLFLRIAEDKNDMFFSGDTAQCIATGVGFRFEDLTTLFKYERDRQDLLYKSQSLPDGLAVKIPIVNTLTVNYRTHNGILAAAGEMLNIFLYLLTSFPTVTSRLHLFSLRLHHFSTFISLLHLQLASSISWNIFSQPPLTTFLEKRDFLRGQNLCF
jgi:superfamily I DNA/RNA helicase